MKMAREQFEENFEKALHLAPDNYQIYMKRAEYTTALRLAPESASDIYISRSGIRFLSGDYQGSIQDMNEAIRLKPNYPLFYAFRGFNYYRLGEEEKAQEDFDKARDIEPDNATIDFLEINADWNKEEWEKVIQVAIRAIDKYPTIALFYQMRSLLHREVAGDSFWAKVAAK